MVMKPQQLTGTPQKDGGKLKHQRGVIWLVNAFISQLTKGRNNAYS
jgi:hypothetical protein